MSDQAKRIDALEQQVNDMRRELELLQVLHRRDVQLIDDLRREADVPKRVENRGGAPMYLNSKGEGYFIDRNGSKISIKRK